MQVTISLGLEELKLLPEELRQKIQLSLGLPVVTAQVFAQQVVQETPQPTVIPVYHPPQAMPAFTPPVQQMDMPAPPVKQPVVQNGIPTFLPSRGGIDQQSIAVDVMSNQAFTPAAAPSAPTMPQFNQAPLTVAPVTTGVAVMAPMTGPLVDAATVRAAAIRTHNNLTNGKQLVAAAQAASGVSIAGLTGDNAHLLANALRQQGVQV
jgi:hypothetical protein